ncbi:hypothetical protein LSAT2_030351 [Lamellibrachia satsuma]|nr:hypothetical protein LSAT2_030351 [Lamellibrachia satsuma]
MAKPQGMAVAGHNYVGEDQIWKDHVKQEIVAARKYPHNWAFMATRYEDLVKDECPKTVRVPIVLPKNMQVQPVTPLEKYVTVYPSTKPVPKTTAAMVGWRSTDSKLKLERYGGYAKPKGGLIKQLNWPAEAI